MAVILRALPHPRALPLSLLDLKDGSRSDAIGGVSKLVRGLHVRAQKLKIPGTREITGGAARIRTG